MDKSPQQFETLLAHLVTRVQKAIKASPQIPALGLGLTPNEDVKLSIGVIDQGTDLSSTLMAIQTDLQKLAGSGEIEAACIAYPDYESEAVVAFLENSENYCIKYLIPVVEREDGLSLDLGNLSDEDGTIFVFGESPEADA